MQIASAEMCSCSRSVGSGKKYFGHESCRGCGLLIVVSGRRARTVKQEREEELRAARDGRTSKGWQWS